MATAPRKNVITIRRLAELCGCSVSTVHRALNRSQEEAHVGEELYLKIRRLAGETGYRPNYQFRSFHTGQTDRIGFLIGSYSSLQGVYVLDGISDVLATMGKTLEVLPCRNKIPKVCEALDHMFYHHCDGIIYWPPSQNIPGNPETIRTILEKFRHTTPILILGSDCGLPDVCRLLLPGRELGRAAALRQLEAGCRKFGVIDALRPHNFNAEARLAYRSTLEENGVLPENILEAVIYNQKSPEEFRFMREIDGLWCYHYVLFHAYRPILEQVCDFRRLHVDCTESLENLSLQHWLGHIGVSRREVLAKQAAGLASLKLRFYSYYQLGALAAHRILELVQHREDVPLVEYLPVTDDVESLSRSKFAAFDAFRESDEPEDQ